jgi:N-acetylglucosaminyl-diphospho-decaprenol L-rhamnosyltransferase
VEGSVDVVVPVHNNLALTQRCLEYLTLQTVPHQETVVDDGSSDGTECVLAERWPGVRVIRNRQAAGFVKAANAGIRVGAGDTIVLLNNDVECRPDFLEHLVAPIRADPRVGSVAALILQAGEQLIDSVGITCDVTLAQFKRLHGHPVQLAARTMPLLIGPEGTAAAYRRSAWEDVGGFDDALVAYGEDFDLALRLRAAGWAAASAPTAVGVHLGSATYGSQSPRVRYLAGVSRGYLLRRYGVFRRRYAFRALSAELLAAVAGGLLAHDCAAPRGRVAGWKLAAGAPCYPDLPGGIVDTQITAIDSLAMRLGSVNR